MKTTVTSCEGEGRTDLFQLLFLPGNHRGSQDEIELREFEKYISDNIEI